MHHSLLPIAERTSLHRDYLVRASIVSCFLLSLAGLIGVAALFPAYIHARTAEQEMLASVASVKDSADAAAFETISKALTADAALVSVAASNAASPRLSSIVASVAEAGGDASITSIDIAPGKGSAFLITIQGKAASRDDLLALKKRLESLAPGATVDLPIAELAASSDIQFSLQVAYPLP